MNFKKEYEKFKKDEEDCTIEEFKEYFDYHKKSKLYKKIFNVLELDYWLDEKDGNFERFVMGGFDGLHYRLDMNTNLRIVLNELKEENLKEYGHI